MDSIPVNHTFSPPWEVVEKYFKKVWGSGSFTNNGPLIQELESNLKTKLGVKHLFIVSNGTWALQLALQALGRKGEVITTPFSFVASLSAILWEGCTPVFSDISSDTLCLDPARIEAEINANTVAIMPTHVYGNTCDIDAIEAIGKKHGIPVIYDAAHAFGSTYRDRSVLNYGTFSCLSMHAFKVFHMVEGGAIATDDDELAEKIFRIRYFGKNKAGEVTHLGTNGKSSELHAAVGLANLNYVDESIARRARLAAFYDSAFLSTTPLIRPTVNDQAKVNFAYYPLIFPSEEKLLQTMESLAKAKIGSRRYFYPSLNLMDIAPKGPPMEVSESVARRVLCLPIHLVEQLEGTKRIVEIVRSQF